MTTRFQISLRTNGDRQYELAHGLDALAAAEALEDLTGYRLDYIGRNWLVPAERKGKLTIGEDGGLLLNANKIIVTAVAA